MEKPLIALQGQHIVSTLVTDFAGDPTLAPHRIQRHDRALREEQIQENGDVPDPVPFVRAGLLAGHEA